MSIGKDPDLFNSERNDRFGFEKDDPKIAGMYDLGKTIGIGHFAVVKLARHVFTNEKVAVKVIDKLRLDELSREHLFQEVVCMKLVKHPNIVRLYHIIDTATKLYLILELGDGGDLYDYISNHVNGINEKSAKIYFRQILNAIAYCHKLHVVHRDLKPENVVFFEKEGTLKLTDFGFSNQFIPGNKLDTSCGSLAYSAPEILLGKPYDAPKVDIWSLGVILYMLVVGRLPFQEKTDSETLSKIMDCSFEIPASMSPECKALISKLLVKDPTARASLDEILADPWVISENQLYHDLYSEPLIAMNELSYEDHIEILNRMNEGGLASIEEIQNNLDQDEYNHITATYYLLAERKLKRHCDDIMRFNILMQSTNTENDPSSPSDESSNVSRNNSVTPAANSNLPEMTNRRFSMIIEDEEYEDQEKSNESYNRFRFSNFNHESLASNIIEEEEEILNEEAEEMETVFSLVQFRSDFPRTKGIKTSSFLHEKKDLRPSQRNSKSLPPSTLAHLINSQAIQNQSKVGKMKIFNNSSLRGLKRMVKTKSCPYINCLEPTFNEFAKLDYNRNPKIEATQSIDDGYIPTLRNPRLRSRLGSMFSFNYARTERQRRSSVASPIGIDSTISHIPLKQIMRARNYPNSASHLHPVSINVQRFIEKRRSVPHNLYRSAMSQFITSTSNIRMSSRYSKISTRSLSSSETPSDSEQNYDNASQNFIKSFTERRRGSSETVQSKAVQILQRKQKTHSATFQNQNFLFASRRMENMSANSNSQEWYNSAPSLLNIESIEKFKTIIQQPNSPIPPSIIPNQVTTAIREFCEPIREEEDETTKSISALNSPFDPDGGDYNKETKQEKLAKRQGEVRTFSSYYPTLYSARESVVNQLPMNWSYDDRNQDAETKSVTGIYYTRKYHFPKSSRFTTGALSPQLTPNISLSSLASSLRQSRHMLDVIRGTFELQHQMQYGKKRFPKNDSENENYSPENSMTTLSNDIFYEHKKSRKSTKNLDFYSSFSDEEFLTRIPPENTSTIGKKREKITSKPSSDNSYNVSLLNESLEDNPAISFKNIPEQRKQTKIFSKSENRLSNRFLTSRTYLFKVKNQVQSSRTGSKKSLVINSRTNVILDTSRGNVSNKNSPSPKQVVKGFRFFCCHK